MRRTVVEIDDELLGEARAILGARTIKEAVNRSLAEVVRSAAVERELRRLSTGEGLDLSDEAVMGGAWR
jgi:Arc/MetJ family transcription regulator